VIQAVDKIAIETEKDPLYFQNLETSRTSSKEGVSNAITVQQERWPTTLM